MIYITRREYFNAAHRLYRKEWTDEQNTAVFGKCANANWHGHNFVLFVTVKGHPSPETGFIIDLKVLSKIIKEEVIEPLDHKNLNEDVPFLKDIMPSIENLAMVIWKRLEKRLQGQCLLHKVKLWETDNNYVEYFGEE